MQDILHRFANVTELIIELLWKLQFGCGQGFTRFQTAVNRLEVRWSLGFCLPTTRDAFDVPRRLWFLCNNLYQLLSSGHSRYCGRLLHHGWLYSLAKSRFKFWRVPNKKFSLHLKTLKTISKPKGPKGLWNTILKATLWQRHRWPQPQATVQLQPFRQMPRYHVCRVTWREKRGHVSNVRVYPKFDGTASHIYLPFAHGACIADKFSQRDFEWQSHTRSCKIHCAFHTFHPCRNW